MGGIKAGLFSFILKEELLKFEANGFGIAMTTDIKKGESPSQKADRLNLKSNVIENLDIILGFVQLNQEIIPTNYPVSISLS